MRYPIVSKIWILAGLLFPAACTLSFADPNESGVYRCDSNADCEPGFACVAQRCWKDGSQPGDSSNSGDTHSGDPGPGAGDTMGVGDTYSGDAACSSCAYSWDCSLGKRCSDSGCCEPLSICTPDSCEVGEVCAADGVCRTASEICLMAAGGCECQILPLTGFVACEGDAELFLPAGASVDIEAVLAEVDGAVIPGVTFNFSVDGTAFSISGATLTAAATAGAATLTAQSGSMASCTADVVNIGQGSVGHVQVLVYDQVTGAPIPGAEVIVDTDKDGADDGSADVTDANGVTITSNTVSGAIDVTVFVDGYHYLSVVGLDSMDADVMLGLEPHVSQTAGAWGKVDYTPYLYRMGTTAEAVSFALAGASVIPKDLIGLSLETLVGPAPTVDCDSNPSAVGCYDIVIPSLMDINIPLWPGLLLSLPTSPGKPHFDASAHGGRQFIWTLGGSVPITAFTSLMPFLTILTDCACDATSDVCDTGCDCDSACAQENPLLAITSFIAESSSLLGSGTCGNVPMPTVNRDDWDDFLSVVYDERSPDPRFPKFDTDMDSDFGKLEVREPLSIFSDMAVPPLPTDPHIPERTLGGIWITTGSMAPGAGFVPLGMGIGTDCTENNCLDYEGNAAAFDGAVNGRQVCDYDSDPARNHCPPEVPNNGLLADGHIGLFHAQPSAGLESAERLTIAIAMPSVVATGEPHRSAALIRHEAPAPGSSSSLNVSFPPFPMIPANLAGRSYDIPSQVDIDYHWVVIEDVDGTGYRWNVIAQNDSAFVAPPKPASMADDPFAATDLVIRHIGLVMPSSSIRDLARGIGLSTDSVTRVIEGYSVQDKQISE